MKKKVFGPALAMATFLLAVLAGFQNCAPPLPEEDEPVAKKKNSASQYPSASTLVGFDPLPAAPTYAQTYTPPAPTYTQPPQAGIGTLPVSSEVITPRPDLRVCKVQYSTAVETSFDGQAVSKDLCVQRFNQFVGNSAFNALQLNCSWGAESCGSRGPVVQEDLRLCRVSYGTAVEVSFDGQSVTRALCEARFNQFVSNAAFNGLQLQCLFGNDGCGSRAPVVNQVLGPCVITFANNIERSFDGQMVTRDLCVARFNQFLQEPAFNPFSLTCMFNNTDNCGKRGPR